MFKKNLYVPFRTINIWFIFVFALIVLSNLPHQDASIFAWVNCCLYFLVFVQSCYLLKKEIKNKDIFINLAIFALLHSLSFVYLLIGEYELFGNDYLAWYVFEYISLAQSLVFALCIIYICVKYFMKNLEIVGRYLLSLAIILPFFLWYFYPYLADKAYILSENNDVFFDKGTLLFSFLPVIFLGLYAYLVYKHDWSLGEYINTIMVCFFIMSLMDITHLAGNIYNITIFVFSQYILSLTLSFFIITMFRRLNFAYSDYGQFYDQIVISGNDWGVPIKRRKGSTSPLLSLTKAYFYRRRNTLGFIGVVSIFCVNYINVSPFIKLNLAAICFGILLLSAYLTALYQKRLKNGDLINYSK